MLRSQATRPLDATALLRRASRRWFAAYAVALFLGLTVGAFSLFSPHSSFPVAAGLYLLGAMSIMLRPVFGVFAITFLGLLADDVNASWWPFLKNGSSAESILFVNDAVIASPMEGYLLLTVLATAAHIAMSNVHYHRPPLIGPLVLFMVFVGVGFLWGIGRGGILTIGLWEVRPFVVLLVLYVLATTLIRTRTQIHALSWTVVAAIVIESVRTVVWYVGVEDGSDYDSLVEHSAAAHMNLLFITAAAAWLVRSSDGWRRYAIPLMIAPVIWVYLISERRSAIAALLIGGVVLFIFLAAYDSRRFWRVTPVVVALFAAYTLVFWNASGVLGFPAGVIKSQISPETASLSDQASDSYRIIEHINILATIHNNPLLGVGFGQQYLRPLPLPDISSGFIWWEYMTHNGIMWIWLKTGYFGFIAMFNLIGRALYMGMRTALKTANPTDTVIAASATIFIPIYMVFSYVDISWGTQSLILLAVCMAIVSRLHDELPASDEGAEKEVPRAPLALMPPQTTAQ